MASVSLVRPRLDSKPWGGRALAEYGLDLPPDTAIGEAVVSANDAVVRTGYGEHRTLGEIVDDDPGRRNGSLGAAAVGDRSSFPLLAKLIDARENLSIQVHPDDAAAMAYDDVGKIEAWHVLAAEPGSLLYLGLRHGVGLDEFAEASARLDGTSAALLRTVPARPGMTVLLPAGTIHALGAGVLVYEIQQPSTVTYRLDDWGRLDADGQSRDMHLDAGLAVAQVSWMPEPIAPIELRAAVGRRHLLTACRYFAVDRLALPTGGRIEVGEANSPTVITLLQGAAEVDGVAVIRGETVVIWPGADRATFTPLAPVVMLRAIVPDLGRDIARPLIAAGISRREVAQLAGPLDDLHAVVTKLQLPR